MKQKGKRTLTPRLRFPEFRGTPGWNSQSIEQVCEILNNRRVPITSSDRRPGPYPYYGASGIVDYVDDFIFDERLVLVGEDGAKWQAFEPTAFIADGKYWVNNHAHVLKPTELIDTLLANYLILQDVGGYVTGAAPPKLTLQKLKTIPIPVPPPAEQQKIADCLGSLDCLIAAEGRKLSALRDHKRGLMQQLFPQPGQTQPRLRFPEFRDKGEWEEKQVGEVFQFKQGVQVPVANQFDNKESGMVRFIRIVDLTQDYEPWRYITIPGDEHMVKTNDLFMIRYGTPGVVAIGYEGVIANNLFRIIWKSENKFIPKFWFYIFKNMEEYISNLSASSSMPAISFSILSTLSIIFPTASEQQKIADCLTALDTQIAAQATKIETLKQHKRGLMQQLFPAPEEK